MGEGKVRWERLFADLEARHSAEAALERDVEVADRTRRERAQVGLHARLLANVGGPEISLRVAGAAPGGAVAGVLVDVGPDWLLLAESRRHSLLVPLPAVRGVVGLVGGAQEPTLVARRFTLAAALRGLSRGRVPLEVTAVDGWTVTGTIDAVGADHVDLAEHPLDQPRRSRHVVRAHVLPFAALSCLRHP
ncbi:hypothetical protein Intca_2498 [Intrasporangium calvum DSM 43043]|uniref:Uncharacterized protein n=1 Tax=Intrasporangium calvum (strain ATCC 23552 / DSM 43043 / JCM 3097 / NBRC 12989 / NCIMB 10167 / NRRL B-3866 / 7 KIP) TaxID=710696 RepID=E6S770_INTC7|nr:hypothetical protein Intca_2498 [Intrasporangium calvum DSM 43043]